MLRDFKFLRRNSGKNEELENVPVNPKDSSLIRIGSDVSRAPLNTIQEPIGDSEQEQGVGVKNRVERTPVKTKGKGSDPALPLRTPDKHGAGFSSRKRFGWVQKSEPGSVPDEVKTDLVTYSTQLNRGGACGNGGFANITTPRPSRTVGRATSSYSESNSTQSTPTKSVTKPPTSVCRSKIDRIGNFSALYKGIPANPVPPTVVNTVEVPHFDLKEDPSFWMEHNVQVLIRVRPLNNMERSNYGYNRCLKQESGQSITWIGQPETRFTFDHVACETVDQEMLFRMAGLPMVENCLSGYNSCMFAYGQTGSGKTYTMLGEIEDLEVKPSPHRGMTPRIFEFLFARIHAEEEIRRDEKLKYNCKCSFLEIYNEQITDLLDPSSTNLLLREDVKKGVYVENLSEFEVRTVSDILSLLTQGSSNRKVAATNMNRESSRSHSVFTCVIESRWEKDSSTNLRFARLNLVDLAGSERQKTSGAEGERLKEAANINKSLSTLGHVIMVLLDVAHGKPRHIPYRDSRLTFLLQDSLGGNSKTMIIANVSPSICCAAETLNTLKFAQRAKLIQNNAVVNEDSTGDVIELQHQIQLLKEELAFLKRQNVSRSLSFDSMSVKDITEHEDYHIENITDMDIAKADDFLGSQSKEVRMSVKQLKSLETTLAGALRREKMAEASIKQLEAEIEQLNRLVRQREEDTRCTKMMLRFREDKIQRMESLLGGSIPAETYLLDENKGLSEEIHLLRAKIDRNPEVTRFALENIRLLDQLRRFQEFYEEGEREVLMDEISKLRDQLLQFLSGNSEQHDDSRSTMQPQLEKALDELEETKCNLKSCLEENKKLSWEIDQLHSILNNLKAEQHQEGSMFTVEKFQGSFKGDFEDLAPKTIQHELVEQKDNPILEKHDEEIVNLQMELDVLKIILKEGMLCHRKVEERAMCLNGDLELATQNLLHMGERCEAVSRELEEAKSIIEALESQQILSINEIGELRNSICQNLQLLSERELEIMSLKKCLALKEMRDNSPPIHPGFDESTLQTKLKRMQNSLEKAKRLNTWYQNDREFQATNEEEIDEVRRQVEAETAEVIVCMQEELALLQQQVQESHLKEIEMKKDVNSLESELKHLQDELLVKTENNESLSEILEKRDQELRTLAEEWELLTGEMEEILADGCVAIMDASNHLDNLSCSLPEKRIWISDQVSKMIRILSEKDLLIEELRRCLEDANNKRIDMESMLKSLRGAALAITEAHQQESKEKDEEILHLTSQVKENASSIAKMEGTMKLAKERIGKTSVCATVAFIIVNRLSELNHYHHHALEDKNIHFKESNLRKDAHVEHQGALIEAAEKQIVHLREQLEESRGSCAILRKQLTEEQEYRCSLQLKLEEFENDNILTIEKLADLKNGVSTLRSCMTSNMEQHIDSEHKSDIFSSFGEKEERWTGSNAHDGNYINRVYNENQRTEIFDCPLEVQQEVPVYPCNEKNFKSRTFNDISDRDMTITLLKKEIESALRSLEVVQTQFVKLQNEKKEMLIHEKQNRENLQCLMNQVLVLQETMNKFEKQSENVIEAFNHKLKAFEQNVLQVGSHWCQSKELLELEVGEAKIAAVHKTAEASCILAKFEEAQETMKEADIMINELMIANEMLKLEIERLKEKEITLITEQDLLRKEVQSMRSSNNLTCQQFQILEEHLSSNLMETETFMLELVDIIAEVQTTVNSSFTSLASEIQSMKSIQLDSTKFVRSCFENIWSEIIVKDCAVSVLHLCHMGILLETVMGLNAENGLLQHGLCESDAAVAGLREQNLKSKRELDMCKILKGKLLSDLKNGFHRIQKKEEEAGEMSLKLNTFEKKITDLQVQEEQMLQRSNYMGCQLVVLMKELDDSNKDLISSLLEQEKWLKEKEKFLESQSDFFTTNLCLKYLETCIFNAELEEMTLQKSNTDKEHINCLAFLEMLKERTILFKVDEELSGQLLLDKEIEVVLLEKEIHEAQVERQNLLSKLNESSLNARKMDEMNKALEQEIQLLTEIGGQNDALKVELDEVMGVNMKLLHQRQALKAECDSLLKDLQRKEKVLEDSSSQIHALDQKNQNLHNDLEVKNIELLELQYLQLILTEEFCSKRRDFQICINHINMLNEGNISLRSKLQYDEESIHSVLKSLSVNIAICVDSVKILDVDCSRVVDGLSAGFPVLDKLYHEMRENVGKISKFLEEFEYLERSAKDVESEFSSLQIELIRKDDVLAGLLFDLSLLQESASNNKDKKDEIDKIMASMEALDNELAKKSVELDKAIAHTNTLEDQLLEKMDIIKILQLNISKEHELKRLISSENLELKNQVENVLIAKSSIEEELSEKRKVTEDLEMELLEQSNQLSQMNDFIKFLRNNLNELTSDRDHLQLEVCSVKEKLETVEALAEENEANLMEAQQVAESRKIYAEEKEAEVKLLERSVEELERTINALENKVDIVKEDAEQQRLQREELELELHAVKNQMQTFRNTDADLKRYASKIENKHGEACKHIQILEEDVNEKIAEIAQLKAHISELNLHAEAQANEYKQKFKSLESMAEQVRPEGHSAYLTNSSSNKMDKYAAKPRGSGSPFKCIGLGLAQQIKSETDEELSAARIHIEELESLAVSRQKEIFTLNARLAAAESMTHDVIRDLLGVKLDMTTYMSLLDNQQLQKISESAQLNSFESQEKAQEVIKLKKQLSEFVEERCGWLEEIDRKQAEMLALQVALEKARHKNQLLKTKNEILKSENINHKQKVLELEGDVKKLSGQQNLQQRIHHHAKIKEENNTLRAQNEDLSAKLHRAEILFSRVKEELTFFRTSIGRTSDIDFDEEQRLNLKLKETEEEKVQLARKLLGICTSVLKAAGVTKPVSDICPSAAEEALEQLLTRISSIERELQDLKFKNKIANERIRLSELVPQPSPRSSKSEDNCQSPKRLLQAPYFSALDR